MWEYEYIEHTADLGVKIKADSLEEIYQAAAYIMFDNILELGKIDSRKKTKLTIKAYSHEELLFNLLKKLLELFYTQGWVCKDLKVTKLTQSLLKVEISGNIINIYEIPPEIFKHEIKTITYHQLKIKKEGNRYTTTVIFDV